MHIQFCNFASVIVLLISVKGLGGNPSTILKSPFTGATFATKFFTSPTVWVKLNSCWTDSPLCSRKLIVVVGWFLSTEKVTFLLTSNPVEVLSDKEIPCPANALNFFSSLGGT